MILDWEQVPLCYGEEVAKHREHFSAAHDTTYALLCSGSTMSNARLAASGGDHAERKLLASPVWTYEVAAALAAWTPLQRSPIVVTMIINRTPCRACTDALEDAIQQLQWRFAGAFPHARFILACRGVYEGKVTDAGYYEHATTIAGLRRLQESGWNLCVLRDGNRLSPRGQMLLQALASLSQRGFRYVPLA